MFSSQPIIVSAIVRQTNEPASPIDAQMWVNPAGGANGNNSERYLYDKAAGAWELTNSVGPDTPLNASSGAMWRDTGVGQQKVYDGAVWANVGVTDHSNLTGVTTGQHHSRPHIETARTPGSTSTETVTFGTAFSSTPTTTTAYFGGGTTNDRFSHVVTESTTATDVVSYSATGSAMALEKNVISTNE